MFRACGLVFLVNLFLIFFPLLDFFNLFEDAEESFAIAAVTVFDFLLTYGFVLWLLWRSFKAAKRFSRPGAALIVQYFPCYVLAFSVAALPTLCCLVYIFFQLETVFWRGEFGAQSKHAKKEKQGYVSPSKKLDRFLDMYRQVLAQESVDATSHGLLNDDVEALYDLTGSLADASLLIDFSELEMGRRLGKGVVLFSNRVDASMCLSSLSLSFPRPHRRLLDGVRGGVARRAAGGGQGVHAARISLRFGYPQLQQRGVLRGESAASLHQ